MMPEMILYLLKVNIALLFFYAGYHFILQRYTFHTLNRFYLLTGLIYSGLYPLIDVSALLNRNEQLKEQIHLLTPDWQGSVTYVISRAERGAGDYWQLLLMVFWTGVIFMSLRLTIQLISLLALHIRSKSMELGNFKFRKITKAINPFSFWRTIYLNPECHEESELQSILEHEQVHVRQLHTLDVMLAELSTIFYWFNPGVWLMKKAIKANLEFITDQEVIRSGIDAKEYQYTLLRSQVLPQNSMPVNNFHFLTIKKRIAMINKKPSNRINLSNYMLLLPAIMLMVLITGISKANLNSMDLIKDISNLPEYMPRSLDTTLEPDEANSALDILVPDTRPSNVINKQPALVQVFASDTNKLGKGTIKSVRINGVLIDSIGTKPLYILDGKRMPMGLHLKSEDIATINVLKGESATSIYGNDGKNGIVEIRTKIAQSQLSPLYVVDGKRMPLSVLRVEPEDIATINVLKGEKANSQYGEAGKNGVIEIRTKSAINGQPSDALKALTVVGYPLNQKISLSDIDKEMIILDGKEITKDRLDDIKVTTIGTIEIFKGASAVSKYGEKAKDGVIVITTK